MPDSTPLDRDEPTIEILHHFVGQDKQAMDDLLEFVRGNVPEGNITQETNPNVRLQGKIDILREKPPNILETWPGSNLVPYLDAGVVGDITGVWTEGGFEEAYFDHVRDAVQFDGRYRAVPTNLQRENNLFYNRAVVERAGIDPDTITDTAGMVDAMERVATETDARGLLLPQKRPWPSMDVWDMLVLGHGGVDVYRDLFHGGRPRRHRELVHETLELLSALIAHAPDDAMYDDWQSGLDRFVEGEAAFFPMGDWAGGVLKNREKFDYGTDWGCTPFPGTEDVYQVVMDAFFMPSNAPNADVTRGVLEQIGAAPAIERFTRTRGAIPPRRDVSLDGFDPFFRDQMEAYRSSRDRVNAARGLGIPPAQRVETLTSIASFLSDQDVEAAADRLLDALGEE